MTKNCPMCGEEKTLDFRIQITIEAVDKSRRLFTDELDVCVTCADEGVSTFSEVFSDTRKMAKAREV